ncbi:MAG TPA: MFS transporter [Nitrospira sp.]|nr:MFS transporter [Nitrospira sp.]
MERILTPFIQLCLISLLARLGYQMARSPVLPRFAQDLGAPPELIGFILAASTITGVVGKLPAGAFSDVLGRKRMLTLGAFFFCGPPFLYPLVEDPIGLLLLRFLHGFATAIFSPVATAVVADLFQKNRGARVGWFSASGEMGSACGPMIGGLLLASTHSFAATYLLVGAVGLLPMVLTSTLPLPETSTPEETPLGDRWKQFLAGIREVIRDHTILIASVTEAFMFLGVGALVGFLPLYAKDRGLSDVDVGVILGMQVASAMLSKPLTGRLSDRVGRKPIILLGLICCAAILPLVTLVDTFFTLLVLCMIFGLGTALVTPSTTALVADLCRAGRHGAALGVFGSIWDTGEALGPIVAGFLVVGLGYTQAFTMITLVLVLGILLFALVVEDPSRR